MTSARPTKGFFQEINIVINKDRLLMGLGFNWKYNA